MAAWLVVYCKTPPPKLDAAEVRRALDAVDDWNALAESFGIEDAAVVKAAREALTIDGGDDGVSIQYRAPDLRPLQVDVRRDEADVRVGCTDARERVDTVQELGAKQVFAHLDATRAIVAVELGWGQLEDMGVVFANAIGEHVARKCDGMIQDQNDDWWSIAEDGTPKVVVGPAWR